MKSHSDAEAAAGYSTGDHRRAEKKGFLLARQSGSHKIYKDTTGKRVTVPFHAQKVLHPKLLRSIMRDAGIELGELGNLL